MCTRELNQKTCPKNMCTLTSLVLKHCGLKTSNFKHLKRNQQRKKHILLYARAVREYAHVKTVLLRAREYWTGVFFFAFLYALNS